MPSGGCDRGELPLPVERGRFHASFHPRYRGFQHMVCPSRLFHPVPQGISFSRGFGLRHCRESFFSRLVLPISTFLPPFARVPLQNLLRSYEGSDSCCTSPGTTGIPTLTSLCLCIHSVSNHPMYCHPRFITLFQPDDRPRRSDFTTRQQARQYIWPNRVPRVQTGYSPPVPPTPPHGDAVTVRYGPES